jgi:Zn-dependent protease/CBS domain-containing protein
MFGTVRWRLFRLYGIPINVDASWLIILALVTWTLAHQVYRTALPYERADQWWLLGLATALLYFVCILLHELGHAVVARRLGIPIRSITLFLFGGVAEMTEEPPSAGGEFCMAIGGPVVSGLLAMGFWGLAALGIANHWTEWSIIMCAYLAIINGVVLVFNMIPAFPLDGGRVLRAFLWWCFKDMKRATYWASLSGQLFAWILFAGAAYDILLARDTQELVNGFWLGLIGLFVQRAARGSYRQLIVREALQGEPVRRFMNPQPIVVPPTLDLRQWVEDYVYRYHRKAFPVSSNGHVEGFISTKALAQLPRDEWGRHTVAELMRHDVRAVTVHPDIDAFRALAKMERTGSNRLLVVEDEHLVGTVTLHDVLAFLQLKLELEHSSSNTSEDVHHHDLTSHGV